MLELNLGDDQRKKVKISLVQADLDVMKQEKERNSLSTAAAKLVSSLRPQRNHEHVRKEFWCCCLCHCFYVMCASVLLHITHISVAHSPQVVCGA